MGVDQHFDWQATVASALEWWRDAGVDTLVEDAPRDWFAAPVRSAPRAEPASAPAGATVPAHAALPPTPSDTLPETLEAFLAWRGGPAVPEAAWHGPILTATGPSRAKVMVLVDCPDRDDGAAGVLMTGATGRLFDRMLAAIGLSRDTVHLAAVCARRPTAGRIGADIEGRLGDLARHHIALVAPERLLLLGNAASRAILGTDVLEGRGRLQGFNHKNGEAKAVPTYHPRYLIEHPLRKAAAWDDLRTLMGGMT